MKATHDAGNYTAPPHPRKGRLRMGGMAGLSSHVPAAVPAAA